MLKFDYNDYQVHIHDTGSVDYWYLDDTGEYVVTNHPQPSIVMLAGSILQLVTTDVVKAEMRVAQIREELRNATIDVERAEIAEGAAGAAKGTARCLQLDLSVKLKAAEGALQLAKVASAG